MAVNILAADDSVTMRRVLELTFAGEAVDISTVDSGEAAVQRASEAPPHLVLADSSMPGTDGYAVAQALKSNPETANVAVIVLASQHHPFDADKARACGVDDHILKPFDSQALIDKAKEVLGRPRAKASAAAAAPVAAAAAPVTAAAQPAAPRRPVAAPPRPASRGLAARGPASPGSPRSTVAFGAAQAPKPGRPALELEEETTRSRPAAKATAPRPARPAPRGKLPAKPIAAAAAGAMASDLSGLGLSKEQLEGVLAISRDVIERVVWEVVPDLAEVMIREEIRRVLNEA